MVARRIWQERDSLGLLSHSPMSMSPAGSAALAQRPHSTMTSSTSPVSPCVSSQALRRCRLTWRVSYFLQTSDHVTELSLLEMSFVPRSFSSRSPEVDSSRRPAAPESHESPLQQCLFARIFIAFSSSDSGSFPSFRSD